MKKLFFILTIIFSALSFAGAGYVVYTGGEASPGYGVVPMLFAICCSQGYAAFKSKQRQDKN